VLHVERGLGAFANGPASERAAIEQGYEAVLRIPVQCRRQQREKMAAAHQTFCGTTKPDRYCRVNIALASCSPVHCSSISPRRFEGAGSSTSQTAAISTLGIPE